ncbi:MAG: acetylxylan esterase, partial [Acidobacteriales bacterium]|nr:acetylxylan esterase [Terriglobales bacterium]
MKTVFIACILACLIAVPLWAQSSDELNFTSNSTEFREIRKMLRNYLNEKALEKLQERQRTVAGISTPEELSKRKAYFREHMLRALGGLPERTPLNPRLVGTVERPAYRIEKIVFESQPRFYVTANLYIPKTGKPPYPAILFPLGHEDGGKSNPTWQQMLGSLATKGFVALTWDPIGQGERVQIYDEDLGGSKVGESTTEHTVLDTQALLVGDHLARYTIWDGIRALDYLLSRPEVDPARVGITGNSGGGTHTSYIASLDDRIAVAAPSCYITSWRQMLETIGPQDGEQVFPGWFEDELDYPDFIYAFAPKPFLMLSAIRDFFPIGGARETYAEASRVYAAVGAADKLKMFEADDNHGYTKARRMRAYAWLSQWLKGAEDLSPEPEIEMTSIQDLNCTPTGQVATSLAGETVSSLNRKRLEQLRPKSRAKPGDLPRVVREASHYETATGPVRVSSYGVLLRPGYRIEKLIYQSEPGILIPSLLYLPDKRADKSAAVLVVESEGKAAAASEAERFVRSGLAVLSIDARGFGETRPPVDTPGPGEDEFFHYFGDYNEIQIAMLLGRPIVGMRARDIARGVDLLAARPEVDAGRIYAYGKGAAAVPLLYAAVSDGRIRKIALDGMVSSYESVVAGNVHRRMLELVVPGALQRFDLPDLAAALAPRESWLVDSMDPMGHVLPPGEAGRQYRGVAEAYR